MDKWNQQLIDVLTHARPRQSTAASLEEMVVISTCEYNELTNQRPSKAASLSTKVFNGTKRIPKREYIDLLMNAASRKSKAAALYTNENKAQLIHNFITKGL
jgi:hypothetical protein